MAPSLALKASNKKKLKLMGKAYKQRGLSLLEVMVAMALVAIVVVPHLSSLGGKLSSAAESRLNTYAHWVAMNRIAEIRALKQWPSIGSKSGKETMLNKEWHWRVTVQGTPDENMRRLEVEVAEGVVGKKNPSSGKEYSVRAYLSGFIGNPASQNPSTTPNNGGGV